MRHRSVRTRIGSILLTGAMLLSLLPMSALATEVTETTGTEIISEETAEAPANGPSDTGTVAGDEKDPDQGTEPTNEVGSGDAATVAAITTQDALEAAIKVAQEGGTVRLDGDIDITEPIVITKELTLDLNGKTIAPADGTTIWKDDIKHWSLIRVAAGGDLTVTGEGTLQAAEGDSYAIDLYDETSKCTIENGTFEGNVHAVYVFEGKLTVNGGTFSVQQKYPSEEYPDEYVLNCFDANYKNGTASITVSGGTFVGFNPSNCRAEGAGTDFCAPGYIVEEGKTGEETSYTVTKLSAENSVAQVDDDYYATLAEAVAAAKDGDTIELLGKATGDAVTFAKSGTYVLDLNGHTYTCTDNYDVIMVKSGDVNLTIQNGNLIGEGNNTYGVYVYSPEGIGPCDDVTVTLNQVDLDVTDQALGVNGTNSNNNLIVKNSTVSARTAIYFPPLTGKLIIENSTVTGVNNAIVIKGGEVEISGDSTVIHATGEPKLIEKPYGGDPNNPGSFPVSGSAVYVEGGYKASDGSSPRPIQVNIQGGTFISDQSAALWGNFLDKDAQTIQVTGGTYISSTSIEEEKDDVNPYCPTGYVATEEPAGTWTVGPADGMEANVDTPTGTEGEQTANATVGGNYSGEESGTGNDGTVQAPQGKGTLTINVQTGKDDDNQVTENSSVSTVNIQVDNNALTSVNRNSQVQNISIQTDVGTLTVDKNAWNTITDNAKGESVTLSISQVQTAEDNKPLAYELTAKADDEDVFAQGNSGTIKVDVPYTANDSTVYVYYVGDDGAEKMSDADVDGGRLTWSVSHFSTYVVTQNENSKAFTVTEDDVTVTEYTDLEAVLDAIASNTINDDVVINLVQGSTHTVDNANYDIDQNVTINGANATINVTVSKVQSGTEGSNHAFQVVGGHTLTLNGVTMNIHDGEETEGGNTVGTYGLDIQYGSTLVLDNADLTISNVSNATISAGSSGSPGVFKIQNNSTLTANGIRGNFSNGGNWTIEKNSVVNIGSCESHGLSVGSLTVDDATVTVDGAKYVGILGATVTLKNGADVTVKNCGARLPYPADGNSQWAPDNGKYRNAVELKGKQELIVNDSTLTLTSNINSDQEEINNIYVGDGSVDTYKAEITGNIKLATGSGKHVATFVSEGVTVDVQIIASDGKATMPSAPAAPSSKHSFVGWSDGRTTHKAGDTVTITKDTTFTAVWNYTGGGSGGSSGSTRYDVSVEDTDNGSIRVSPSRASRGQTVTITVDPDEGYVLDRLIVRDSDGDRIDLERKSATKYTFEMPRGKVTVEATFVEGEEENVLPFRDVDVDDWFYDAVVYAYENDLMSGVSAREFAPNSTLTRAMVAQMLWAMEGKPQVNYLMQYADVGSGDWYAEAVRWASSQGIMSGYGDSQFGPNDPVTRQQLALILYNYAKEKDYDTTGGGMALREYSDYDAIADWAVTGLGWAVEHGLISGMGDGVLAPTGGATRAQVAQIFMNFCEDVAE